MLNQDHRYEMILVKRGRKPLIYHLLYFFTIRYEMILVKRGRKLLQIEILF